MNSLPLIIMVTFSSASTGTVTIISTVSPTWMLSASITVILIEGYVLFTVNKLVKFFLSNSVSFTEAVTV